MAKGDCIITLNTIAINMLGTSQLVSSPLPYFPFAFLPFLLPSPFTVFVASLIVCQIYTWEKRI